MRYSVFFIVLLFIAVLLNSTNIVYAGSERATEKTEKFITSKHDRKVERRTNWIEGLEGDKARIYELYGYPSGKYREEVLGTVVERWVYPEHGITFKFKGSKLTR